MPLLYQNFSTSGNLASEVSSLLHPQPLTFSLDAPQPSLSPRPQWGHPILTSNFRVSINPLFGASEGLLLGTSLLGRQGLLPCWRGRRPRSDTHPHSSRFFQLPAPRILSYGPKTRPGGGEPSSKPSPRCKRSILISHTSRSTPTPRPLFLEGPVPLPPIRF